VAAVTGRRTGGHHSGRTNPLSIVLAAKKRLVRVPTARKILDRWPGHPDLNTRKNFATFHIGCLGGPGQRPEISERRNPTNRFLGPQQI